MNHLKHAVTRLGRAVSVITLSVTGLSGCGLNITNPALFNGSSVTSTNPVTPVAPAAPASTAPPSIAIQGYVGGDQWFVSGASIQLYAIGTQGPGSSSNALLPQTVITDGNGNFVIDQSYSCPSPTSQLYLVASGGTAGQSAGANNAATSLLTMLGACNAISATAIYPVNEVTTIGALWPFESYIVSVSRFGVDPSDTSFAADQTRSSQLVNLQQGTSPGSGIPAGYAVQTEKLNVLANDLHACVVSSGGAAGDGSPCGQLFALSTSAGGVAPTDTFQAALQLAHANQLNPTSLFQLAPVNGAFQPVLAEAPVDWNLDLVQVPGTPVIQPASGSYLAGQQITMVNTSGTGTLHYTVDGSTPTKSSPVYDSPLILGAAETVKAVVSAEEVDSPVASSSYSLTIPHLTFASQPSNIASGSSFSPTVSVSIVDSSGKPLQMATPVSLALNNASPGSSLDGVTTSSDVNGTATFSGLGVSGSGSGVTLIASAAGMASVASSSFSITAAPSATPTLSFSFPGSALDAGSTLSGSVTLSKPAGPGGLSVQVASSSPGVLGVSSSLVTISAGQTSAPLTISGLAVGVATVTVSSAGANSASMQISVGAAPIKATHLVFVVQPSALSTGAVFNPVVTVQMVDDSGKVAPSTAPIALSLSGSSNAVLSGSSSATASNGIAVFPGLGVSAAGSGYTLVASSPGLGSANSNSFNVTDPAPSVPVINLSFPTLSIKAGSSVTGQVLLSKPAASGGVVVQLSMTSPGIATVTPGMVAIAAGQSSALISCSGLAPGSATLAASATGGNTATVNVTVTPPAVAAHLVFGVQPTDTLVGVNLNPSPTVSVVDSSGNLVSTNDQISLSLSTSDGNAASMNGTSTVSATNGVAVFSTLSVPVAGTAYQLTASSTNFGTVQSAQFSVTAAVSASPIPPNAQISSYLEASNAWRWSHDPGTPGSSIGTTSYAISSPSMSGASRVFSLTYTGHGGEIYHLSFGLDKVATHFVYESWVYIADPSQLQNVEMDMNHVMANGQTIILGTQCASGSKSWEYTKVANGGPHWYVSNIPCDPRSWAANTWHHVQIASHHDSNGVATYDWVNVDGNQSNFQNASGPSALSLGWQLGDMLINFQLDGYNKTSGAITVYTEKMAVYRW